MDAETAVVRRVNPDHCAGGEREFPEAAIPSFHEFRAQRFEETGWAFDTHVPGVTVGGPYDPPFGVIVTLVRFSVEHFLSEVFGARIGFA